MARSSDPLDEGRNLPRRVVLDDLVDRPHDCDFLLDASLSRAADDYAALVPSHARLMIGPEFALLRPEFAAFRANRLPRHHVPRRYRILVMFGATDHGGQSVEVVTALAMLPGGLVLDGELIAYDPAVPARALSFQALQRRLGRNRPSPALRRRREGPRRLR